MAPQKGNLMTFREDVRVLDCTIRDGGLCNDFRFTDDFVRDLYQTNLATGTDYMEFGYKASVDLFNPEDFGKWKFCSDEDIYDIVGDNDTNMKVSVMADVGRTDYKRDIRERSNSPVDLVRVATYVKTIPAAIDMIEHCAKMGYETTCNVMAVTQARREDLLEALELLGKSPIHTVYIVDSYGSLYPEEIRDISDMYLEKMDKYGKQVGIHAHNNMQLAFANTITACANGVSMLDATMNGMGRGAGNCMMEQLMTFLAQSEIPAAAGASFCRAAHGQAACGGRQVGIRHAVPADRIHGHASAHGNCLYQGQSPRLRDLLCQSGTRIKKIRICCRRVCLTAVFLCQFPKNLSVLRQVLCT